MEQKAVTKPSIVKDDTKHLVSEFLSAIACAKSDGQEWVETSPEIIQHFNKRGMGTNPLTGKQNSYFVYDGIKVCETGKLKEVEEEMNLQTNVRLHGKEEGTIIGR
jgi:hypothetical protein